MDTTITALASLLFGFIGVLGGSILQTSMANAKVKLEIEEERRREKIIYLQNIIDKLIENRGRYIFEESRGNRDTPPAREAKSNIEGFAYSIDDSRIQQLMQSEIPLRVEDIATESIIRLGEMINEQMQISPVKTVHRWFWQ